MGDQSRCTLRVDGLAAEGTALLEGDRLVFRGGPPALPRLSSPLASISALAAEGGALTVTHADGAAVFELGEQAERWARKILSPRSRLDKLGVAAGARVVLLGVKDAALREELAGRGAEVATRMPARGAGLVFLAAESPAELERLGRLRAALAPDGAIWVVHRKGKDATLRDTDVFAAAKRAGLVDTKVVAFSATHTAEKLVIPVKDRPRARG